MTETHEQYKIENGYFCLVFKHLDTVYPKNGTFVSVPLPKVLQHVVNIENSRDREISYEKLSKDQNFILKTIKYGKLSVNKDNVYSVPLKIVDQKIDERTNSVKYFAELPFDYDNIELSEDDVENNCIELYLGDPQTKIYDKEDEVPENHKVINYLSEYENVCIEYLRPLDDKYYSALSQQLITEYVIFIDYDMQNEKSIPNETYSDEESDYDLDFITMNDLSDTDVYTFTKEELEAYTLTIASLMSMSVEFVQGKLKKSETQKVAGYFKGAHDTIDLSQIFSSLELRKYL